MARTGEQVFGRRHFGNAAQIHHRDPVGDVLDDGQVVADEDLSQAEALSQVDHQIQNLRLNENVERGNRFVGDVQARHQRDGAKT